MLAELRSESYTYVVLERGAGLRTLAAELTRRYGEQFTELTGPVLPLGARIGNATGIQYLGHGRYPAAAEPVRSGGGSALVVRPSR